MTTTNIPVQLVNPIGSTSGQVMTSNGPSSAPSWKTLTAGQSNFTQNGSAFTRTVQAKLTDSISVKDYGAKGDGVTDDTAAFTSALSYLQSIAGGELYIPQGNYILSGSLSFTLPSGTSSITIVGSGADVTRLTWASAQGITINFNGTGSSAHIRDLSLLTGSQNSGTALTLNQLAASIPVPNSAQSDITNVTIRGADGYGATDYWSRGVFIFGVSDVNFTNAFIDGNGSVAYQTNGTGVSLQGNASLPTVVFNFTGCTFNAVGVGIQYGNWVQGVSIVQCNFTGDGIGINAAAGLVGLDQLYVGGSQFNCTTGINSLSALEAVMIVGNLFLVPQSGNAMNFNFVSVTTIVGNTFNPSANTNTLGNGIVIGTTVLLGAVITGNAFYKMPGTAVFLTASSSGNNVQSNIYAANGANVTNSGAGNTVGGGSQ